MTDSPAEQTPAGSNAGTSRWLRLSEWWEGVQPRRLSLRVRILLMFAVGALFLSGFLAAAAYSFTRSSVVNQRDNAGIEQAYRNAQAAQNDLRLNDPSAQAAMDRLQSLGVATFAINYRGNWSASSAKYTNDAIPLSLQDRKSVV